VGGVLVAVGLWGLWHLQHSTDHFSRAAGGAHGHVHATAALSIGTLHGLVGTGSTLAVLPAAGMHSFFESAIYLAGFGAGTVVSMMGVAWLLGVLAPREEGGRAYRIVFLSASLGSALAGVDLQSG
jgi:sulfite exporter TauE/SafE